MVGRGNDTFPAAEKAILNRMVRRPLEFEACNRPARSANRQPMRNRTSWIILVAAAAGAALWFSHSVGAVETKAAPKSVVFDGNAIVLLGTDLSKADDDAMNKILNRYDKSLYRLDTYENGKRMKTHGMSTAVVNKKLASEIAANTKKPGFTHHAMQICNTTNPTTGVNGASSANIADSKCLELVNRLKPILEKYRRK